MEMVAIEGSSNVDKIGYDEATGELRVLFKNGATYHALGVPPEDHEKFIASDSKGKYFGKLRALHTFSRVEEEE
jgi:hypothetical protein